jgi:hypothetical protein
MKEIEPEAGGQQCDRTSATQEIEMALSTRSRHSVVRKTGHPPTWLPSKADASSE